jgi:hypothetical protein
MSAPSLIKAIGLRDLGDYFDELDEIRESGIVNMFGAAPELQRRYPGMSRDEARAVLSAWMDTFDGVRPPEDRAGTALEKAA